VDVTLTGPKGSSRADLRAIATRMCMSKLEAEGFSTPAPVYGGTFREKLNKNEVSVSIQANLQPISKSTDRGAIRTAGNTPFVSQGQIPLAPPVRSRLLALLSPPFDDPCSASPGTQPVRSTTPATTSTTSTTNPDGTTTTTTTAAPGVDAPGTQLVPGGSVGMAISDAVAAVAVAASTPVGPAAFATGQPAPTISIEIAAAVPDPTVKDAIDFSDSAPYDFYECRCVYSYDSGRRQMPGTGIGPDGGKATFFTVHGGVAQLKVFWACSRRTVSPVVPRFESPNTNFVALKSEVQSEQVEMSADGRSPTYTVSGFYEYGVVDPAIVSAAAPIPSFLTDTAAEASKLAVGFFSDRIIWKFQGEGPNPFTTTVVDQKPGSSVAKATGAFLQVAGIPVPPAFAEPEGPDGAD
jgi:hypothetical protein